MSPRSAWTIALPYLAFFLLPLGWLALTSFWPDAELARPLPSHLTLENHAAALSGGGLARAVLNSLLVSGATAALALALAAPAAFAVARLGVRGGRALLGGALAISMFPPIATAAPLYTALRAARLLDTLPGLVAPYTSFSVPLALWLLTGTFRALPVELYRAARVDGCTPLGAFRRVLLPLAAPGLATAGLLVFVFAWNELLYAVTFLTSPSRRTVPVALALFGGEFRDPFVVLAAASTLATAPVVAIAVLFQRRVVAGLTAGAVKG
ncbi:MULTISPECIES: carbohydrate ABC transporter permease [Anaeromyxobacter]|uniref:carbohydrate ABC transporter permease n=1 Tax=Anaeromyxobacter TaxID=161492 RepID=UPI001F58A19B|nr:MULTISPECIES: carbohydrate ABC transporter permease [unclassified Anaeromyxobacter]